MIKKKKTVITVILIRILLIPTLLQPIGACAVNIVKINRLPNRFHQFVLINTTYREDSSSLTLM